MATDYKTVLQAIDLVELVSQTVALKRLGRKFLGLCPFHQEKSPSFNVDPVKQYFYCFGCKASGTAFDFVMRRDRVEFKEALHTLAQQAGIQLEPVRGSSQKSGERQALLDAHSAACRFFENLLMHPEQGAAARQYLAKRGFTDETLKRFQVGLAPDGWDGLLKSPVGRKFSPQLLAQAGLVKTRDRGDGFYDTFRNRIMFPIRNENAQIIAFGGRVMPGSEDPAKYLNSPETPLFSKSKSIFGIDLARQRIVETRTVAVTEGYTDTCMAHQFGASNVVSALGTALTEQHVTILRRFADRIVLLFDADAAGEAAVKRVVELFLTQPVEIAVATLPSGLDPDEFLLQQGLEAFDKLIAGAVDALGFAWRQLSGRFAKDDLTGQEKAVAEYLELVGASRNDPDSLRWGAALLRVSKLTGIPVDDLHRRLNRPAKRKPRSGSLAPAIPEPPPTAPAEPVGPPLSHAQLQSERSIMGALLIEPNRWHSVQLSLRVEDFLDASIKKLAKVYWDHQRDEGEPVINEFLAGLSDADLISLAIELVDGVEQMSDLDQALEGALSFFAEERRRRQTQKIVAQAQRGKDEPLTTEAQVDLLKTLQEQSRQPNLRRVGR